MSLFVRYEKLSSRMKIMNAEATSKMGVPYIHLYDYVHYCSVMIFLSASAIHLQLSKQKKTYRSTKKNRSSKNVCLLLFYSGQRKEQFLPYTYTKGTAIYFS